MIATSILDIKTGGTMWYSTNSGYPNNNGTAFAVVRFTANKFVVIYIEAAPSSGGGTFNRADLMRARVITHDGTSLTLGPAFTPFPGELGQETGLISAAPLLVGNEQYVIFLYGFNEYRVAILEISGNNVVGVGNQELITCRGAVQPISNTATVAFGDSSNSRRYNIITHPSPPALTITEDGDIDPTNHIGTGLIGWDYIAAPTPFVVFHSTLGHLGTIKFPGGVATLGGQVSFSSVVGPRTTPRTMFRLMSNGKLGMLSGSYVYEISYSNGDLTALSAADLAAPNGGAGSYGSVFNGDERVTVIADSSLGASDRKGFAGPLDVATMLVDESESDPTGYAYLPHIAIGNTSGWTQAHDAGAGKTLVVGQDGGVMYVYLLRQDPYSVGGVGGWHIGNVAF